MLEKLTADHVIAARRELAKRSLRDFACMIDIPDAPMPTAAQEDSFSVMKIDSLAQHHDFLLEKLEQVESGLIKNLMVLMPPGSAKSTYVDIVFVAWFIAKGSRRSVLLASYNSELAEYQSRKTRQLINSDAYKNLMQCELKNDQRAASTWAIDNGSGFRCGGILSGLTGRRAYLGILDDPFSGRADADSETIRNRTWKEYISSFCSRLVPGAPQVMILTRWHEDDVAGRILPEGWNGESGDFDGRDGRKWHVICMPAIADRHDDPLGRKPGEVLWKEWFSLEHFEPFKRDRRDWSSLYQQKPTPDDGTYFQKQWFKRYRVGSEPLNLRKYLTSDHAPGGADHNDFNCFRVWGIDEHNNVYLLDGFRTQETLDKSIEKVLGNKAEGKVGLIQRHKPYCWFPENDNNYKSIQGFIAKQMREEKVYCRIEPINPHGADKLIKAQSFQGMASMGMIYIADTPEGDDIIDQYIKFPAGKNDDEVDAASLIGRAINDAHPAIVAPAPRDDTPPPRIQKHKATSWRTR